MAGIFLICLIIALAAIAYWRITLAVTAAVMLALLVSGVNAVTDGMHGDDPAVSVVAPDTGQGTAARHLPPG